jgi:hypothetical protein
MRIARAKSLAGAITLAALAIRCTSFGSSSGAPDAGAADDAAVNSPDAGNASVSVVDAPDGALEWAGNGHKYLFVSSPGTDYETAKLAAKGMRGHLVTFAQADENDFVFRMLTRDLDASYHKELDYFYGPWLGAERIPDSGAADAAYAWTWVTDEPFTFTDWDPAEPNDQSGAFETRAIYFSHYPGAAAPAAGTWADIDAKNTRATGFVVEFE